MFARQRVFYGFCPSLAFCTANIRRKLSESCFRLQNYNFFLRTKHIHPPIFRKKSFCCGSWRFFIGTVGGFSLVQLAVIHCGSWRISRCLFMVIIFRRSIFCVVFHRHFAWQHYTQNTTSKTLLAGYGLTSHRDKRWGKWYVRSIKTAMSALISSSINDKNTIISSSIDDKSIVAHDMEYP